MAHFFAWLLAAVLPLAKKVLIGLGVGVITYTGVDVLLDNVTAQITIYLGQIAVDLAGFLALAGFFQSVGILLGALAARASLAVLSRMGMLT